MERVPLARAMARAEARYCRRFAITCKRFKGKGLGLNRHQRWSNTVTSELACWYHTGCQTGVRKPETQCYVFEQQVRKLPKIGKNTGSIEVERTVKTREGDKSKEGEEESKGMEECLLLPPGSLTFHLAKS